MKAKVESRKQKAEIRSSDFSFLNFSFLLSPLAPWNTRSRWGGSKSGAYFTG
jgi:hypothetical protein